MSKSTGLKNIPAALCAGVLLGTVLPMIVLSAAAAQGAGEPQAAVPQFSSVDFGWTSIDGEWTPLPGSPQPVTQDPRHEYVANNTGRQPTFRYANADNPNLTQWARDQLKKDNEKQDKGFAMYSRESRCWPTGVPVFLLNPARPTYFIQTPKEVLMMWETDHVVRHIYMDVPHSENPKPSWYGESVGHYEGDTLVVDTIGQKTDSFIDNFRTPHGPRLHVVERYRLAEGGRTLETEVTIEDPDALVSSLHVLHRARKVDQPMVESSCAESGGDHFPLDAEPIPTGEAADF